MKSIFAVIFAASLIFASAWMIAAGAAAEVFRANEKIPGLSLDVSGLDFEDPLRIDLLDWGAVGATGNLVSVVFEHTAMKYNISMSLKQSQPAAVPEPASMFLLGTGLIAIAGIGRKKLLNKKNQTGMSPKPTGLEARRS